MGVRWSLSVGGDWVHCLVGRTSFLSVLSFSLLPSSTQPTLPTAELPLVGQVPRPNM